MSICAKKLILFIASKVVNFDHQNFLCVRLVATLKESGGAMPRGI